MRVLLEVRSDATSAKSFTAMAETSTERLDLGAVADSGMAVDESFGAVAVPRQRSRLAGGALLAVAHHVGLPDPDGEASYVVRGSIPDAEAGRAAVSDLLSRPQVMGVFSDPVIATTQTCGGDPPVGTSDDVALKLDVGALANVGMTGSGVRVAVVDTGINAAHLGAHDMPLAVDEVNSFSPTGAAATPGNHPVDHGTMCAYDVGIAAPDVELLDHALLLSRARGGSQIEGLLSDAVRSFSQLRALLLADRRPLVVNNSWGVFDPASDFPVVHPGNYSDNPRHPFNLIVASLESAGADVLFAAGNCGVECPDGRCKFTSQPICGANSHPSVSSVGGIDVKDERVGYSSQGPGRLSTAKPDVCAYTHFLGSEAFGPGSADSGTSAACPVAAGVVAAVRSKCPPDKVSPAQLRALMAKTATDLGHVGFDHDHGWGALFPPALIDALP